MKLVIELFKFLCVIAFALVVCTMVFGCSMLPGIGQMSDRWCNAHPQAGEYQCTGRALANSAK